MNGYGMPGLRPVQLIVPVLAGSMMLAGCLSDEQMAGLKQTAGEWGEVASATFVTATAKAGEVWDEVDFEDLVTQAQGYLGDLYGQTGGLFSDLFGDPVDKKQTFDRVANRCPEMIGPITRAAERTDISANYLLALAYQESSCNPDAKARGTTAAGMFQFVEQTWLLSMEIHGGKYGHADEASAILVNKNGRAYVTDDSRTQAILDLRHDPELSAYLAAELAKDNYRYLKRNIDRDLDPTDLYMAHFLGPYGATQFLAALESRPGEPAAELFPPAAKANPWVFYTGGPGGSSRSVRQVHSYFKEKIERV